MTVVCDRRAEHPVPTAVLLAFHAAVDDAGDAVAAWDEVRATIDLDTCWDPDILRVLPLVWRNLMATGVNHRDLARLAGAHRRNWYAGHQALQAVHDACLTLASLDVPYRVLGGVSLVQRFYDGPGDRPVDDTAVVVSPSGRRHAAAALGDAGWATPAGHRPATGSPFASPQRFTRPDLPASPSVTLVVTPNPWCSPMTERQLVADPIGATGHQPTPDGWATVSAEMQLMVTLLGGASAGFRNGHAWMVDVVQVLRSGAVDGDALVDEARRQQVGPLLLPGLFAVASHFGVSLGDGVTTALARAGATRRARWAAGRSSSNHTMERVVTRWVRATHRQPVLTALAMAPAVIAEQSGVDRPGALPAAWVRRVQGVPR